jgi:outer membrane receptor protein involved in Fe transport
MFMIVNAAGQPVPGGSATFTPDTTTDSPKWSWSLQPSIMLEEFLRENVSVSATIFHRGPNLTRLSAANNSVFAGITPAVVNTVFGPSSDPFHIKGFTRTDLRVDWKNVFGHPVSTYLAVTNVTNNIYNAQGSSIFNTIGIQTMRISPPRMWYVGMKYEF